MSAAVVAHIVGGYSHTLDLVWQQQRQQAPVPWVSPPVAYCTGVLAVLPCGGARCPSQMGYVLKKDLQKKKNDDEVEEGWVQCDCCDNWVHMICGLFNKGRNDQNVHYLCPRCLSQVRGWAGSQPTGERVVAHASTRLPCC